jgi:hypothetical protein
VRPQKEVQVHGRLSILSLIACVLAGRGVADAQTLKVSQTTVRVTPVADGRLPPLSYWPFATHVPLKAGALPTLVPIGVGTLTSAGCGAFAWHLSPLPGGVGSNFCVATVRTDASPDPLLVVGQPGRPAVLLVPVEQPMPTQADDHRVAVRAVLPNALLPATRAAIGSWLAAPTREVVK